MEGLYNSFGKGLKRNRTPKGNEDIPIEVFIKKLRRLLTLDDLAEIIDGLFELQAQLIEQGLNVDFGLKDPPSLNDFFQHLAPILLRATRENLESVEPRELLLRGWKEALRVAIEEEIYVWQEKMF